MEPPKLALAPGPLDRPLSRKHALVLAEALGSLDGEATENVARVLFVLHAAGASFDDAFEVFAGANFEDYCLE